MFSDAMTASSAEYVLCLIGEENVFTSWSEYSCPGKSCRGDIRP